MTDEFVPESVLKELVVGARVRYIPPNSECYYPSQANSYGNKYDATSHETFTEAEYQVGTISDTTDPRVINHTYLVEMDAPYHFGNRQFNVILVAAHELVLIEGEDDEQL